jgi:hypothetical protein
MKKIYTFIPTIGIQIQGEMWCGGWGGRWLEFSGYNGETLAELTKVIEKNLGDFQPGAGIAHGDLQLRMMVFVDNGKGYVVRRSITRWFDIRMFPSLSHLFLDWDDIQEIGD